MNKIENLLKEMIITYSPNFEKEEISSNTDLIDDLLFDSLSIMQLIADIEKNFNIELNEDDLYLDKISKFSLLLNLISKKL